MLGDEQERAWCVVCIVCLYVCVCVSVCLSVCSVINKKVFRQAARATSLVPLRRVVLTPRRTRALEGVDPPRGGWGVA